MLVSPSRTPLEVDGVLDEDAWQHAQTLTDFFMNYPLDSIAPRYQSEVKITFDDHFVYFGVVCFDDSRANIVRSLRRDIDWERNDNFGIFFDPFGDFTNGFYFLITPLGVQSEGLVSGGGADDDSFSDTWDNKWYSKVNRLDDRWIAEIAIPFKTIRFNRDDWNITFVRNDVKRNEVSSWIATPIQYDAASFSYAGRIKWAEPLPKPGSNVSLIPYMAGAVSYDRENQRGEDHTFNAGLDAKIALSPSMNLDLTINPDFSQVEVDRQVINLTRFEFGFPERRQFFLENSDLFSQPGFPDSRPFFSRRIGIAVDSTGEARQLPILYGARLSGKAGRNWRVGLLNMQTGQKLSQGLPGQNYTVAVVQRQVFSRSNIGLVFVNKQNIGVERYDSVRYFHPTVLRARNHEGRLIRESARFNRVFGADFNLFTKKNNWQGDIYYHRSVDNFASDENYSYAAYIGYNNRRFEFDFAQQGIGKGFNAEAGFVPALSVYPGLHNGFLSVELKFYPSGEKIAVAGPQVQGSYTVLPDGTLTDWSTGISGYIAFTNTASLNVSMSRIFQRLPSDFNPVAPMGDRALLAGQEFEWSEYRISYSSDTRKLFNYNLEGGLGGFYSGKLYNVGATLNYRYQPIASLSVQVDYNDIRMPEEIGSAKFFLVGPRLDLTFTDKLFFTTFFQYNNRFDNVNLNTRFQWRFKPASDIFLVYTENYLPESFGSRNRALVLKLTYWFNL